MEEFRGEEELQLEVAQAEVGYAVTHSLLNKLGGAPAADTEEPETQLVSSDCSTANPAPHSSLFTAQGTWLTSAGTGDLIGYSIGGLITIGAGWQSPLPTGSKAGDPQL